MAELQQQQSDSNLEKQPKGKIPWGVRFKIAGVCILELFILSPLGAIIGESMGRRYAPGWWNLLTFCVFCLTWRLMTAKYRR